MKLERGEIEYHLEYINFEEFVCEKYRCEDLVFKAIACLVEVLNETLRFFDFPCTVRASIRTINVNKE